MFEKIALNIDHGLLPAPGGINTFLYVVIQRAILHVSREIIS